MSDTPASSTLVLLARVFLEMTMMAKDVTIAPRKADAEIIHPETAPRAVARVTANPAPELTPMIPGAARELASTLCITAPEMESAKPAAMQATVLGSLEYQNTYPATLSGPARAALTRSESGMDAAPETRLRKAESSRRIIEEMRRILLFTLKESPRVPCMPQPSDGWASGCKGFCP